MKFLDLPPIARIDSFLKHIDVGEYTVYGTLEAYSCKLAGLDKKLSKSLDQEVQTGSSPSNLSRSPVGPLCDSSSRKTLIYLILTLNHIYPDYDFSQLRPHHFQKEDGMSRVEEIIDSHLLEVSRVWSKTPGFGENPFLECLWNSINEAMEMQDCDVYQYKSDQETDPFGEQTSIWAFNYFLYNKKLKRILYFSCRAVSKTSGEEPTESDSKGWYNTDDDENEVDKYGMAGDMEDVS